MRILDISKNMYACFYYNVMKNRYNDEVSLLYIDTDSLIMEIKTKDLRRC